MGSNLPRVLLISSVDPNVGPGVVALEQYNALKRGGLDVDFLTKYPVDNHPDFISIYKRPTRLRKLLNWVLSVLHSHTSKLANTDHFFFYKRETKPTVPVNDVLKRIVKPYDVVYILFWQGVLSFAHIEAIHDKLKCQIQFRCVDYSPIAGGCHFLGDCTRYQTGCGMCPGIESNREDDFTRFNVEFRKRVYEKVKPVVYGNTYMNSFYRKSFLLKDYDRLEVAFPLSDNVKFHPLDQEVARKKYGIQKDNAFVVLFGCQSLGEARKGMAYLLESLKLFYDSLREEEREKVLLVIIGRDINSIKNSLCFDYKYLGFVSPEDLPAIYSMASVYLSPSVNDAGPSMVNQSMSCGTPVVSFEMGTALDVVKDKGTGYCAALRDSEDFAKGISTIFHMSAPEYENVRVRCREVALELTSEEAFVANFLRVFEKYKA